MNFSDDIIAASLPGLAEADRAVFTARCQRYCEDAFGPLRKLYGQRADFEDWCQRILMIVAAGYADRPTELRQLDEARLSEPDWFQHSRMIGYACYVDRFAGTLQGVAEKTPYLKELGVTYLHLLPLLKPRPGESDGGFATQDFRTINPDLGTMEDLGALTTRLRGEGISLCIDLTSNHTAEEHEWAQKAIGGDPVYRDYYLTFPDRELPDVFERDLDEVFPNMAPGNFTYNDIMKRWVWTTFYPFQWDLNYANPAVFSEILETFLYLANQGVEVLRLDSAAYMWKRLGTDCKNQPEVHLLLQAFRALVRIAAPGLLLKAEAIVPPRHLPRYLGSGPSANKECHLTYHNTLMVLLWDAIAEGDARLLNSTLLQMPPIPDETAWITYLRCHDDIGWYVLEEPAEQAGREGHAHVKRLADFYNGQTEGSFARGVNFQVNPDHDVHGTNGTLASLSGLERALEQQDVGEIDLAISRILLMHSLIFAFGGIPLINMGDELGMLNDPSYRDDPKKAHDGRWLHRPMMDWAGAENRSDDTLPSGRIFAGLVKLAQMRPVVSALHARSATDVLDLGNECVFALRRGRSQDMVLVLANMSDRAQTVARADVGKHGFSDCLTDRLSGADFGPAETIDLGPYDCVWLQKKDTDNGTGNV